MHKTLAGDRSGDYNIGVRARPVRAGDLHYADSKISGCGSACVSPGGTAPGEKPRAKPSKTASPPTAVPDGFYRDLVWNLRNGVLAVTRDGRIAVMNEVAYRILGLTPHHDRYRSAVHRRS